MSKTWAAILFFAAGFFVQEYRKNAAVRRGVNNAVKRTEQEINDGLLKIISEIEQRGGGLKDLRNAVESVKNGE